MFAENTTSPTQMTLQYKGAHADDLRTQSLNIFLEVKSMLIL